MRALGDGVVRPGVADLFAGPEFADELEGVGEPLRALGRTGPAAAGGDLVERLGAAESEDDPARVSHAQRRERLGHRRRAGSAVRDSLPTERKRLRPLRHAASVTRAWPCVSCHGWKWSLVGSASSRGALGADAEVRQAGTARWKGRIHAP